jgi:hypothetical protein
MYSDIIKAYERSFTLNYKQLRIAGHAHARALTDATLTYCKKYNMPLNAESYDHVKEIVATD